MFISRYSFLTILRFIPGNGSAVLRSYGIKSINSLVANKYIKIRVGVGHPGDRDLVTKHVLNDFTKDEQDTLNQMSINIADLFDNLIKGSHESFASQVNQRK